MARARRYVLAPLLGLAGVLPFFILEWWTTSGFARSGFPLVLFIFMWVNSTLFAGVLLSALKDFREGTVRSKIVWFSFKIIILAILGLAWVNIVLDQMPCFLGGGGC